MVAAYPEDDVDTWNLVDRGSEAPRSMNADHQNLVPGGNEFLTTDPSPGGKVWFNLALCESEAPLHQRRMKSRNPDQATAAIYVVRRSVERNICRRYCRSSTLPSPTLDILHWYDDAFHLKTGALVSIFSKANQIICPPLGQCV